MAGAVKVSSAEMRGLSILVLDWRMEDGGQARRRVRGKEGLVG